MDVTNKIRWRDIDIAYLYEFMRFIYLHSTPFVACKGRENDHTTLLKYGRAATKHFCSLYRCKYFHIYPNLQLQCIFFKKKINCAPPSKISSIVFRKICPAYTVRTTWFYQRNDVVWLQISCDEGFTDYLLIPSVNCKLI